MNRYKRTIETFKHRKPYRTILLQQKKEQQKQLIQNFSDHITLTESISPDNEHIFINYQKQYKSKILPILSRSVTKDFVAVLQQIQAGKFPQNTKKILQKNGIGGKSCNQFIHEVLNGTFTFQINTCKETIPTNDTMTCIQYKPKGSLIYFPRKVTQDFITAIQRIKQGKIATNIQEILQKNNIDNIQNFIYQIQLGWIEFLD